jgi:diketogulonate reductase-like aldo/keto reductase
MRYRRFGPMEGEVAVIGLGTWYIEEAGRPQAIAALRRGLDLNMNHIDTAEMYGGGAAEEIVGEAIAGRRDEVFLVSKVLPTNAARAGTIAACERSLRHLGTDRLDCYLLHWRGSVPLQETFLAFDLLQRAGKILSWGVSNFDVGDLEEVYRLVGGRQIACNQVLYHLQERSMEHAVIPWCEKHKVSVTAYSPFGPRQFSQYAQQRRPGACRDRNSPRRDATSGRARISDAPGLCLCNPQGIEGRSCRGKCRCGRSAPERPRTRAHRRGVPAGSRAKRTADALRHRSRPGPSFHGSESRRSRTKGGDARRVVRSS